MKTKRIFALVLALVLCCGSLAACGNNNKDVDTQTTPTPTEPAAATPTTAPDTKTEYSVIFYDGDSETTILTEVMVEEGKSVAVPELIKEGYQVAGYYATPALVREFDFASPITRETKVFVAWESTIVDERAWMMAGSFVAYPDNAWGKLWPQDPYIMQPVDGAFNTFSITMNLYKGDEFKIAVIDENYTWDDNATISSLMLADQTTGQLTSGNDAFDTGANIKVMEEGQYILTLKTDAETLALCKLYYERIGDAPQQERPTEWYMLGNGTSPLLSASNWGDGENPQLTEVDTNVYEITLDLAVDDEFCVCSDSAWNNKHYMTLSGADAYFENGGNIKVLQAGSYTITLTVDPQNADNDTLTYVYNGETAAVRTVVSTDFFIKGATVTAWADSTDAAHKLQNDGSDVYTLSIDLYKDDQFLFWSQFNYDDGTSSTGTIYVKYENVAQGTEFVSDSGGNIATNADGTYTFTYDAAANTLNIAFEAKELAALSRSTTWYMLGSGTSEAMAASNWGGGVNPELTGADGTYSVTVALDAGDQFKICADASWADEHGFASITTEGKDTYLKDSGNIEVLVSGTYTFVLQVGAVNAEDTITFTYAE